MSTVLVVEYDQQHRVWMRQVLESKGYQVEEAGDGYEALACIERGRLALVVLDLSLPKVNGLEIIIYLQAHSPSLKILAICANLVDGVDTCRAAWGLEPTTLWPNRSVQKSFINGSTHSFLPCDT
jgi:CheY-like chemotaxis protein